MFLWKSKVFKVFDLKFQVFKVFKVFKVRWEAWQGGPGKFTHPYLLKLLQVAEILQIILFQNEKVL